jgi:hypothetical protein
MKAPNGPAATTGALTTADKQAFVDISEQRQKDLDKLKIGRVSSQKLMRRFGGANQHGRISG